MDFVELNSIHLQSTLYLVQTYIMRISCTHVHKYEYLIAINNKVNGVDLS